MEMLARGLRAGAVLPAGLLIAAAHVTPGYAQLQSPVGVLVQVPSTGNDCVAGTCSSHGPIGFGNSAAVPFSTTRSFPNGDSYQLDGVVGISENSSGTSLPGKMSVTITAISGPGLGSTTVGEPDNFLLHFFLDYTPNGNANELSVTAIGSFSAGVGAQSSVQVSAVYCGSVPSQTLGPISPPPNTFSDSSLTFVPACQNQLLVDTSMAIAFRAGTKPGAFIQVGTFTSPSPVATHDANGDTFSDITWRDTTGDIAVWAMNGASVLFDGSVASGVPASWSIVGQRDFNGDGKSDLLWRDNSGNLAIWFLNGAQAPNPVSVAAVPNWTVIGTGDFNGDHMGDILWQDTSGNLAVWLMNGASILSSGAFASIPSGWTLVDTGDFNGDGKADLLWHNSNGDTAIWFMNGTQVSSAVSLGNIPNVWSVVGTGDFNGDGKSDIVWRDGNGNTVIWLMNSGSVLSAAGVGTIPTIWSIATTGDFNGDGMSDLLWRDTSGNTAVWFMNGTSVLSTAFVATVPTNWTVQSAGAD
jgi:FG-GAP-like repeat